jgi:mono/diheme cytochrome c family protein
MKKGLVLVSVVALLSLAAGGAFAADAVEHGKEVYAAQKCAMCHSIAGKGNAKSPLDGVGSKLKADEIKKWVKTPKEMKADAKMKAYPNLADKDLEDLTAFLLTLKK